MSQLSIIRQITEYYFAQAIIQFAALHISATNCHLYKRRIFLQHFISLTWQPRFSKHLQIMQT